jgi:predicted ATPase
VTDNAEHLIEACAELAESLLRRIRLHHTASTAVNPLHEGIGQYLRPID